MKSNKGFTLVEILVVIAILSLLIIIAIPASQAINSKIKKKLYQTKINLAESAGVLWAQDNQNCFTTVGTCEEFDSTCNKSNGEVICEISLITLANAGYLDYDKDNKIEDPRDGTDLNDTKVTLVLKNNKTIISKYLSPGEEYTGSTTKPSYTTNQTSSTTTTKVITTIPTTTKP